MKQWLHNNINSYKLLEFCCFKVRGELSKSATTSRAGGELVPTTTVVNEQHQKKHWSTIYFLN
jgi:hypothetical protein